MSRYIKADKEYLEPFFYEHLTDYEMIAAQNAIDEVPTADVEAVRHGKWVFETRECLDTVDNNGEFLRHLKPVYKEIRICSVCNACLANTNKIVMGYCPHCGAKMDGE